MLIFNLDNYKNCQFGKFEKCPICKIFKIPIWEIPRVSN